MAVKQTKSVHSEIREYSANDIERICAIFKDVWGQWASDRARKRFMWQFEDNHCSPANGPAILVMEEDEKIVGLACGLPCLLKVSDQYVPSQWAVDFMVNPQYRGRRGILLSLQLGTKSRITLGFPIEKSVSLWCRGGGRVFSEIISYSRILNFKNVNKDKKYSSLVLFSRSLAVAARNAWVDVMSARTFRGIAFKEIEHFDKQFDDLWERESDNYNFIQVRNAAFLNWRFVRIPHVSYKRVAAYRDGLLVGYVVVRVGKEKKVTVGYIVDVFAQKNDRQAVCALFQKGIAELKRENVDVIKCAFITRDPVYAGALKEYGLVSRGRFRTALCYSRDGEFDFDDQQDRFFSLADSDLDFA